MITMVGGTPHITTNLILFYHPEGGEEKERENKVHQMMHYLISKPNFAHVVQLI